MQRTIALFLLLALASGCTRVEVHKNPDPCDKGIRYYRPKPYLLITPSGPPAAKPLLTVTQGVPLKVEEAPPQAALSTASEVKPVIHEDVAALEQLNCPPNPAEKGCCPTDLRYETARPTAITMSMQYLPDFSEEYSIQLKPGLGIGELQIKLDNGWNLTSVGIKTDQQTDEIISSTAELLSSLPGVGASATKDINDDRGQLAPGLVYATNVPFGFYEAVIATDPCGRKQLYGWRYVGFMPFQCCPVQSGGMERVCCDQDCHNIYGLVWVNGILQFQEIAAIPRDPQCETVDTANKKG